MKPYEIALSEYGVTAIVGSKSNPDALKYFAKVGHKWVKDDDTAWCAAFTGYCLETAGIKSTKMLNARSYLDWGTQTKKPTLGDVVVLWRVSKDSAFGHVGFFVKETSDQVYILGGNQNNQVNISAFPKSRVLGYRKA